jgi:putative redox protein
MIVTHRKSGLAVTIQAGNHTLISDVEPSLGGKDDGPNPHALLEAALGACTSITVQMYANRKGWPLKSCSASVMFIQEDKDAIIISRTVEFEGPLDGEQKSRLLEIADKCPIHQVLTRGVKIMTSMKPTSISV